MYHNHTLLYPITTATPIQRASISVFALEPMHHWEKRSAKTMIILRINNATTTTELHVFFLNTERRQEN